MTGASTSATVPANASASPRSKTEMCGELTFVEGWRKTVGHPGHAGRAAPAADPATIDIWIAPVHRLARGMGMDEALTATESRNFERIRVAAARDSTVAGRVLLRLALSRAVYGRVTPLQWRFATAWNGKPAIADGLPQFHFSVTHTERLAIVAVSRKLPIGIDAESIEQSVESDVASHFCCPGERAALETLPPAQNTREFLRLWTLKEAFAKMVGVGASVDFSTVGFSFDSLSLVQAPSDLPRRLDTHFETMFVANGNGLSHLALAVGWPSATPHGAEIRIMTLAGAPSDAALHLPCVPAPTHIAISEQ